MSASTKLHALIEEMDAEAGDSIVTVSELRAAAHARGLFPEGCFCKAFSEAFTRLEDAGIVEREGVFLLMTVEEAQEEAEEARLAAAPANAARTVYRPCSNRCCASER